MDVQARTLTRWWWIGLGLLLLLGLLLRLRGIHHPILDHPAWRQGDTASIARNFAKLQFDVMSPQTSYNGAPPNYVELELQIVPFLAAALYKLFGVHAIFGRLITLAFSLATIATVAAFARWLFVSRAAGLIAGFFFAVFPGSVYYGRTFTPDTAMAFFLTAALYAVTRLLVEDDAIPPRPLARATALLVFAYLAKPVAVAGIVPVIGVMWERLRGGRPLRVSAAAVLVVVPLLILAMYDQRVAAHAEWHWASGITRLHVVPALLAAFASPAGFLAKAQQFREALGMLRATMLGNVASLLAVASFVALPWVAARSKALLWGWFAGGMAYAYVVVTVERVDYYLYLLLPLGAIAIGGVLARFVTIVRSADAAPPARYAVLAIVPLLALTTLAQGEAATAPYYRYDRDVYRDAVALDRELPSDALVVIGHYGPDVQYYIDRFGWEEDPELWTPFDEESAIRKGARYFISIEDRRLRRNAQLCAWLSRFPLLDPRARWPVYQTDPARVLPHAQAFWQAFRAADRGGRGRAFLDAHRICRLADAGTTARSSGTYRGPAETLRAR